MGSTRPVLISFVATFLKREMLHVYRQTTNLQRYENWIVTRRRENAGLFPAPNVVELPRHPLRAVRRAICRMGKRRITLDSSECRALSDLGRRNKARVLHVYFGTEASRCLPFLRQTKMAKVVSFHGVDLSTKMEPAELDALRAHVDLFLCRSQSLADELSGRGVDQSLIRLNYTGVPVPPQAHQPASGPPRLLQACRFLAKKGLDSTVQALAILRREGHDLSLTLAGDGPEMPALREMVSSLGLDQAVTFTGFLGPEELARLYREHDLFLHPSRTTAQGDREGIPNALLEAMAHGLPVVSTRHSGIPEAVVHGENGWLIDKSDPAELAGALRVLVGSAEERGRLGAQARRTITERFSTGACIDALESSYDEACALAEKRREVPRS